MDCTNQDFPRPQPPRCRLSSHRDLLWWMGLSNTIPYSKTLGSQLFNYGWSFGRYWSPVGLDLYSSSLTSRQIARRSPTNDKFIIQQTHCSCSYRRHLFLPEEGVQSHGPSYLKAAWKQGDKICYLSVRNFWRWHLHETGNPSWKRLIPGLCAKQRKVFEAQRTCLAQSRVLVHTV